MILIDTSVLIDYLRSKDPALWTKIQTHDSAICGIVRGEILAGARNPGDRARLLLMLNSLAQATTSELIWNSVGDYAAELRSQGVNVPLADIVIATLAIDHNVELWTRDGHFANVQRVLPALRLFPESP
jgi:predicted nucleic acid-binding protein